jgi:beta-N-acetylhexosaminidase
MSESRAMISGCAGKMLTAEEESFFREERPWGLILFARNVGDAVQIAELCAAFRDCVGRAEAPVFVDQEGGRVQRLRPPLAPTYPPAARIGALYRLEPRLGARAAFLMSRLHAFDLSRVGINVDCLPVLDVPVAGAHGVIGERAYDHDPQVVTALGRVAAEGLVAGGVLPVMKHIPGHGRARVDSHLGLPVVEASLDELLAHDFVPFRALRELPMAMTAHIVFTAIDPGQPATTSPVVVSEVIRGIIGFDGLLMSDDISMQALSGDFRTRTRAIFGAGCDIVLQCSGVMDEMRTVAGETPPLSGAALARATRALRLAMAPDDADETTLRAEFASLVAMVG